MGNRPAYNISVLFTGHTKKKYTISDILPFLILIAVLFRIPLPKQLLVNKDNDAVDAMH